MGTTELRSIELESGVITGRVHVGITPEALSLWAILATRAESQMLERALDDSSSGVFGPARSGAMYFLTHLQQEFAGGSSSIATFTHELLSRVGTFQGLSCWDVGAAPYKASPRLPESRELWEVCRSFGGSVTAFEPSAQGYARLTGSLVTRLFRPRSQTSLALDT